MMDCHSPQREHIAQIRRERFLLADDGSALRLRLEDGTLYNPQTDDLHNAIQHLAEGLYSKDVHFVLELIQNAEDNHYTQGVRPHLVFRLLASDPTDTPGAERGLLVLNNEIGFSRENIEAICRVGKSTKTDKREGYIGEKGIGFKSVFLVSARPHLLSAGYQIRFQEEPDPEARLGYIVPYWVPNLPDKLDRDFGKTCLLLPIKPGKYDEVLSYLRNIAPETILFLTKIERLTVEIEGEDPVDVARDRMREPLVELSVADPRVGKPVRAVFWVYGLEADVPPEIYEDKRKGIATRKVTVAFPLSKNKLPEAQVFAFLPTEVRSGLPFLIDTDFILTASRESISFDRRWNRWLRDRVADTFVKAFQGLLLQPEYRFNAYAYIPVKEHIGEQFFRPTAEDILKMLSGLEVVLVNRGETLVRPEKARTVSTELRSLLGDLAGPLPKQLQETPVVCEEIADYRSQLEAIGVRQLSKEEILNCFRDQEWLDRQSTDWFRRLYAYLAQQEWASADALREVKILPLRGGDRVSHGEQAVYFSDEDAPAILLASDLTTKLRIGFLDSELAKQIGDDEKVLDWSKKTLGVRLPGPLNYCLDMAKAAAEHLVELTVSDIIAVTRYVKQYHGSFDAQIRQQIKGTLPIALATGEIIAARAPNVDAPLVVPQALDPDDGWQLIFASPDDRADMSILSELYLQDCATEELSDWRKFFRWLGATEAPSPRKVARSRRSPDFGKCTEHESWLFNEFKGQFAKEFSRWYLYNEGVSNYPPPHWMIELANGLSDEQLDKRSRALVRWLNIQADGAQTGGASSVAEPPCFRAKYLGSYSRNRDVQNDPRYERDSEFKSYLLKTCWLRTTKGFQEPPKAFLDRNDLREMFGDTLAYSLDTISDRAAKLIKVCIEATVDELLGYLRKLAAQPAERVDRGLVEKVYSFLNERWRPALSADFKKVGLILSTKPRPAWVTSDHALWANRSAVFGEAFVYLEGQYDARFRDFFVKKIGVRNEIDDEHYAKAWLNLAAMETPDPKGVEQAMEVIYPVLLRVAKSAERPEWWKAFQADAEVWTQSDQFAYGPFVYIPDDGVLRNLFDKSDIQFAWRPAKDSFADYEALYRELGVHSLAESVEIEAQTDAGSSSANNQDTTVLTAACKRAICQCIWNELRQDYERLKASGKLEQLLRTREQVLISLRIVCNLDSVTRPVEPSIAYWQAPNLTLYLSTTDLEDRIAAEVPATLARQMVGQQHARKLENFIGRVLGASEPKVAAICLRQNWTKMPVEEEAWIEHILTQAPTESSTAPVADGGGQEASAPDVSTVLPIENGIAPKVPATSGVSSKGETAPYEEGDRTRQTVRQSSHMSGSERTASYGNGVGGDTSHGVSAREEPQAEDGRGKPVEVSRQQGPLEATDRCLMIQGEPAREGTTWIPDLAPDNVPVRVDTYQPREDRDRLTHEPGDTQTGEELGYADEGADDAHEDVLSAEEKLRIGRWGERYALRCVADALFRAVHPQCEVMWKETGFVVTLEGARIGAATWVNSLADAKESYDIEVEREGCREFVEVKSTKTMTKSLFQLSGAQWHLARQHGDKYHIFRVYGALTNDARAMRISGPSGLLEERELSVHSISIRI